MKPRSGTPLFPSRHVPKAGFCLLLLPLAVFATPSPYAKTPSQQIHFKIADPENLEFPKEPRSDLSVNIGGGKGVVISPHWVMTASHCISSKRKGVVPVKYVDQSGKSHTILSDKVIRSGTVDIALVRLTKPAKNRQGLLLLKDGFPVSDKTYKLKKVAGNAVWKNIPARVSKKSKGERFYVSPNNRKGKAGTSGSPWVIHSPLVGDVLVGVTHGTGRVPQVGKVCKWIQKTVSELSDDTLTWATPKQALAGNK